LDKLASLAAFRREAHFLLSARQVWLKKSIKNAMECGGWRNGV